MSGMQESEEARGAETDPAEHGQRGGSQAMVEQSGKKTGGVAGVTVCAKTAGPVNADGVRRSAAGAASRRVPGSRKPPRSPQKGDRDGHAVVESVAELIVITCEDPERRKKRLKVAEALRERGLDESKLAATYSGLTQKLSRNTEQGAVGVAAAKLLFDVLKELTDRLEPQKTMGNRDASEAPQFVRLIHNVPRPVRTE